MKTAYEFCETFILCSNAFIIFIGPIVHILIFIQIRFLNFLFYFNYNNSFISIKVTK